MCIRDRFTRDKQGYSSSYNVENMYGMKTKSPERTKSNSDGKTTTICITKSYAERVIEITLDVKTPYPIHVLLNCKAAPLIGILSIYSYMNVYILIKSSVIILEWRRQSKILTLLVLEVFILYNTFLLKIAF
eukprot:TRINITY_DN725_c0_g1_i14.p1 TRINITY_DN725_c0_g1~~TRINITY_DN725_c0_g1_i14.p1  ORF type:complete len:154 (+),score=8.09 TRINITY_DN725_c0_g1_i14:67-462(+)